MSNIFSFKRLWKAMKCEISLSWLQLALSYALISIGLIVFTKRPNEPDGIFLLMISLIVLYYMASHVLSNLDHKPRRIQFLTLPATNFEKFTARFILYCLIPAIMVIAVLQIAFWIEPNTASFLQNDSIPIMAILLIFLFTTTMAIVFLGGCVFNRYEGIKTIIALMAMAILVICFRNSINFYPLKALSIMPEEQLDLIITAYQITLCAITITIGYWAFKHKTINDKTI